MIGRLLLFVCGIFLLFGCIGTPGKYDSFAQCLTSNGVQMYGAWWCPHCNSQKAMFADSWKHVKYVECSSPDRQQLSVCSDAGIRSYPTWHFADGSRETKELSFEDLSQKTGCILPQN